MNWKKEWKKAYRNLEIPRAADVLPSKAELTGVQKTPANTQKAKRKIPLRQAAALAACLVLLAGIVPLGITAMRQTEPPVTPGTESGTPLDTNPSVTPVTKPPVIEPPENGVHSADELVERIRVGGFIYYANPPSATVIEPDPDGKYYYANVSVTADLKRALEAADRNQLFAVDLFDLHESRKLREFSLNGRSMNMVAAELWGYEKAYYVYRTLYELGDANIVGEELSARLAAVREWRDYLKYANDSWNDGYLAFYDSLGVNVDDFLTELPDAGLAIAMDRIAPALEDCEAAIKRLEKEYDEVESAAYRANPTLPDEVVEGLIDRGYEVYSYFMYGWQQHMAIVLTKEEFDNDLSKLLGDYYSHIYSQFLPVEIIINRGISPVPGEGSTSPTGKIMAWEWESWTKSRSMSELRSLYPQYFELSVENGVDVYAFARDCDVILCAVFPAADHVRTLDEIYTAPFIPDCEAVNILLSYEGLTEDQITVHVIPDPVAVWEGVEPGMEDFRDDVLYCYYRDRREALKTAPPELPEIPAGKQLFTYTPTELASSDYALTATFEPLNGKYEFSALVPDSWKIKDALAYKDGLEDGKFEFDYLYRGLGLPIDKIYNFWGGLDYSYAVEGTTDTGVPYYGHEVSEKLHAEYPGYYSCYSVELVFALPDNCYAVVCLEFPWEDVPAAWDAIRSFSVKMNGVDIIHYTNK